MKKKILIGLLAAAIIAVGIMAVCDRMDYSAAQDRLHDTTDPIPHCKTDVQPDVLRLQLHYHPTPIKSFRQNLDIVEIFPELCVSLLI